MGDMFGGVWSGGQSPVAFRGKPQVATYNDLPVTDNVENDLRAVADTDHLYIWTKSEPSGSLSDWKDIGSTVGNLDTIADGSTYGRVLLSTLETGEVKQLKNNIVSVDSVTGYTRILGDQFLVGNFKLETNGAGIYQKDINGNYEYLLRLRDSNIFNIGSGNINYIDFSCGGSTRLKLENDGNVLIPNNAKAVRGWSPSNFPVDLVKLDSSSSVVIGGLNANTILFKNEADATRVTIANDGKVGIGVTPTELLDVDGNIKLTGNIAVDGTVDGIDIATDVGANTSARHTQGTDLGLDTGGTNPVTAETIKKVTDNLILDTAYLTTSLGEITGQALTTGSGNTLIGYNAGNLLNTGGNNTCIGRESGASLTTAANCTFIGSAAGNATIASDFASTGIGRLSLGNATGSRNSALGQMSGRYAVTNNTCIGYETAGASTASVNHSVLIGHQVGKANSGDSNVLIGYQIGATDRTWSNKLAIDVTDRIDPLLLGDFSARTLKINGSLETTGELTMKVYSQTEEPTLDTDNKMCIWIDTDDSNRTYLLFRRGTGDQIGVELA